MADVTAIDGNQAGGALFFVSGYLLHILPLQAYPCPTDLPVFSLFCKVMCNTTQTFASINVKEEKPTIIHKEVIDMC